MDYNDAKKKKMEELKQRYAEQQAGEQKELQMEMQIDAMMKQMLSPDAKSRLSNVRLVSKEKYLQAIQALMYLRNAGQIEGKVSDEQMKLILEKISGEKKDFNITRK